jgi:putative phosphoribosyl transferase
MATCANHQERIVEIPIGHRRLSGGLVVPPDARGVVVFAHGSGSGRFSPRNHAVARSLEKAGLATLLFDLLAEEEAQDRQNVFDIGLLARRLQIASIWLLDQPQTSHLRLGYFGTSTGAAAALVAAARKQPSAGAVVSRGGRPDLADQHLALVWAPTLLIVGASDHTVVQLNEQALGCMHCTRELAIIPGATHLFEEPGALEEVSRLATKWFLRYLDPARQGGKEEQD